MACTVKKHHLKVLFKEMQFVAFFIFHMGKTRMQVKNDLRCLRQMTPISVNDFNCPNFDSEFLRSRKLPHRKFGSEYLGCFNYPLQVRYLGRTMVFFSWGEWTFILRELGSKQKPW